MSRYCTIGGLVVTVIATIVFASVLGQTPQGAATTPAVEAEALDTAAPTGEATSDAAGDATHGPSVSDDDNPPAAPPSVKAPGPGNDPPPGEGLFGSGIAFSIEPWDGFDAFSVHSDVLRTTDDPVRNVGAAAALTGIVFGGIGTAAFVYGFDVERQLRSSAHDGADVEALLLQRTMAGLIAWPTSVLAGVWLLSGVGLLLVDETPTEATLLASCPSVIPACARAQSGSDAPHHDDGANP